MSYAAILKPSDLVLGSPQLSYQVRKWRRGRNKEYIPSFPFLTRVLSSLLSCKQSFTSVFHVLNNLPPGKYTTCWEAIPDVWTNLETTLQEQQGFELGNAFPTVQKWWSSFKPLKLTIENKKKRARFNPVTQFWNCAQETLLISQIQIQICFKGSGRPSHLFHSCRFAHACTRTDFALVLLGTERESRETTQKEQATKGFDLATPSELPYIPSSYHLPTSL